MVMEKRQLKIGELEGLSGVPRHTIHNYVRHGLLPEPVRTGKTMAYYDDSHLERLLAIQEVKGSSRVPLSFLHKLMADSDKTKKVGGEQPEKTAEADKAPAVKRRQQIREAARRVFLEKGYQQARIEDITTAAGVSTGTFYIYFKDKQELFMEIIDELTRNTVASFEAMIEEEDDFQKRAVTTAQYYIENYEYFSGIINQLRGMMASTAPSAREKFVALHNQMADPIAGEIRAAIADGLIRDVDPELLARAIMGMVEFLAIFLSFNRHYTTPQVIPFMIDLIMNGIGADR
jgi:AcrR family transcriptional regulator/predicted DNA-binding transcriptional regulator AlpA